MNNRFFIVAAVVFCASFSGTGLAIENSSIRNPVGFRSFPPSGIRSGLVRSPNPIDTSGNLVVTGNVRGGRHFRGVLPYRAGSYFGAATGSSSLDSFLRYSAGSENFGRYTGTYKPFYSASRTVTSTRPGQADVIRPPTTMIGGYPADSEVIRTWSSQSNKQTLSYYETGISGGRFKGLYFVGSQMQENAFWAPVEGRGVSTRRPMSMTSLEMERAILAEVGSPIYKGKDMVPTSQERAAREKTWMEQSRWELEQAKKRDTEVEKSLAELDESLRLLTDKSKEKDVLQPFELQRSREQLAKDKQRGPEHDKEQRAEIDVYEQTKKEIDELQRSYERLAAVEPAKGTKGTQDVMKDVWERKGAAGGEKGSSEKGFGFLGSVSAKSRKVEGEGSSQAKSPRLDEFSGFPNTIKGVSSGSSLADSVTAKSHKLGAGQSDADLSAEAKAILGTHKSFASFVDEKFNQHLIAGEKCLKQGKYYRSADAYTLALIYKPEEPLAYAGKSHALFSAGEYMSSALYLSRAMAAESEKHKAEGGEIQQFLASGSKLLASIDRDKLEDRVVDVERWYQRSNSAELQFLLSYIYYQMGRLDAAAEAVAGAYEKMPDVPAVIALKRVIDSEKEPHRDKNL